MKRRDFFNKLAGIAAAPVVAKYATLEPEAKPFREWKPDNWMQPYGAVRTYADGPFPRQAAYLTTDSCCVTIYRTSGKSIA